MKLTNLIITYCFLIVNFGNFYAQTTAIPDASFEANLIAQGFDTNGVTGDILNTDAQAVINLDISNDFNIFDITGIEAFVNMQSFNCSQVGIFNLDLSQNIALRSLNCSMCFFFDLDLSNNLNLETLICNDGQLLSLDLSQNTNLSFLNCSQNHLSELNIQNGNNIAIPNNQFNALFNDLTCIQVDDMAYSTTNWLQKDVQANYLLNCNPTTLIPDVNFETALINLGIDTNGLTGDIKNTDTQFINNLDVSNQNITDLTGIEAFLDLNELNCSQNQLQNLDVSTNNLLSTLYCNNNSLTNLNFHINLGFLHCQNNGLVALDVSNNNSMFELNCNHNNLQALNVSNNNNLQWLFCFDNNLNNLDLSTLSRLRQFNCSFNNLQNLDLSASVFFLEKLICNDNQLATLDVRNGINNNISTVNFNATNNNLTCIEVSDEVYTTANWTTIDLGVSFSTDCFGVTVIPDINFENKLIALGIDTNGVTGDILNRDAQAILNLDLSNSNIADLTGIEAFSNLTDLNCSFNQLNNLNINANTLLQNLNCSNNNLGSLAITQNVQLVTLNCSHNSILTLFLFNLNNLDILNCSYNNLNVLNLNNVHNFSELYCSNNNISTLNLVAKINLTNLECGHNNFNAIDVSNNLNLDSLGIAFNNLNAIDISSNINLRLLSLGSNNLNVLDVSSNLQLILLDCRNNNLNTLDVSLNINLLIFDCRDNVITDLDLSTNVNLSSIKCQNNQLNSLNVKNGNNQNIFTTDFNATNNNLICIQVNDVAYSTANWTNIDLGAVFDINCIRTTVIPDANFENKLIALGIDTNGFTGDILNSDAESTINLDISNSNIGSLDGIEAFVNLIELDIRNNNLPIIDINANIKLKIFNASNNFFQIINISNLIDLEILDVSQNDISGLLDTSQNVKLINLTISNTLISELDLKQNTDIVVVNAVFASLVLIDVSNCNKLEFLNIQTNILKKLDVSNNLVLRELKCYGNDLQCLDLSNNIVLKKALLNSNDLHCINLLSGNNQDIIAFNSFNNPNLHCIKVSDEFYMTDRFDEFQYIDNQTSFSDNCYPETIWNGVNWSNNFPDNTKTAIIQADYNTEDNGGSFTVKDLKIDANFTLTIAQNNYLNVTGEIIKNGNIFIKNKGSFVQTLHCDLFKGNGIFTVEKTTNPLADNNRFVFWSSPIENVQLNNVFTYANQNHFYTFDIFNQSWRNVPNTNKMNNAIGYIAKPKNDAIFPLEATVNFVGKPNNGVISTPVIFNVGGIDDDNNLIGNPYASAIDADLLFAQNLNLNTLYFWTANSAFVNGQYQDDDYATYTLAGGTAANSGGAVKSKYIASGQGFFATTNTNGEVKFTNSIRVTNFNNDFRNSNITNDKIWLNMYHDAGLFNQILIAFLPNGTNNFDQAYDGLKLNSGNTISFYSLDNNQEKLAIQAKGLLNESETIALGYKIDTESVSSLKIGIAQLENLENVAVYLKDNLLNITHNLKNSDYEFTVLETGNFNSRFELIFNKTPLSITNEIITDELIIFNETENKIVVKMNNASVIKSFVAYDILGKDVMRLKPNKSTFRIKTSLKQGTVLFIKATLENDQVLLKKFLKN